MVYFSEERRTKQRDYAVGLLFKSIAMTCLLAEMPGASFQRMFCCHSVCNGSVYHPRIPKPHSLILYLSLSFLARAVTMDFCLRGIAAEDAPNLCCTNGRNPMESNGPSTTSFSPHRRHRRSSTGYSTRSRTRWTGTRRSLSSTRRTRKRTCSRWDGCVMKFGLCIRFI